LDISLCCSRISLTRHNDNILGQQHPIQGVSYQLMYPQTLQNAGVQVEGRGGEKRGERKEEKEGKGGEGKDRGRGLRVWAVTELATLTT